MSNTIKGNHLFTGPATIVFAGNTIDTATDCEIQFDPKVLVAPDPAGDFLALDVMCPEKSINIIVKDSAMNADTFSSSSGYNGNVNQIGGMKILTLDDSIRTLPEGTAAVAFTRPADGKSFRLFLKRAKKVPQGQSVKLSKSAFSEFAYMLIGVTPGDGSSVLGFFEEGTL